MDDKQIKIFDEIFKVLESTIGDIDNDVDGLQALGAILSLSDDNFEAIKPVFLANIETVFNE